MNVIKNKHYQINGDLLKTLTLKRAVKLYSGSIPEEVVTEEWEKLNPKSKKTATEETGDQ